MGIGRSRAECWGSWLVRAHVLFKSRRSPAAWWLGLMVYAVKNGDKVMCRNRRWELRAKFVVFLWIFLRITWSIYEEVGGCVCVCVFFLPGLRRRDLVVVVVVVVSLSWLS